MINIRQTILQQRMALSARQREQLSQHIHQQLIKHPAFIDAKHIACYLDYQGEVQTQTIIETIWQKNKYCYLPCIEKNKSLKFLTYTPDTQLIKRQYAILEPQVTDGIAASDLDVVITPLVAFDEQCQRMGYGQGYYDRSFDFLNQEIRLEKPMLIGLAYELQKLDKIISQAWDVKLDYIITEKKIYGE